MTHAEFMQNLIYQFGDWKEDKKRGITARSAEFRKKEYARKLSEMYMEEDLDKLWDLVLVECEYKPSINALNKLTPGRVLYNKQSSGYVPSSFGLQDEYTTRTGRYFGEKLGDFMKPHKMDRLGTMHEMTEGERQELIARQSVFWSKLIDAMGKVPEKIKEVVFFPERCRGCGRRIHDERKKGLTYCNGCGLNVLVPSNVMRDSAGGNVGLMLAEKVAAMRGAPKRELKI